MINNTVNSMFRCVGIFILVMFIPAFPTVPIVSRIFVLIIAGTIMFRYLDEQIPIDSNDINNNNSNNTPRFT